MHAIYIKCVFLEWTCLRPNSRLVPESVSGIARYCIESLLRGKTVAEGVAQIVNFLHASKLLQSNKFLMRHFVPKWVTMMF